MRARFFALGFAAVVALPSMATAAEDAGGVLPTFSEGDVITFDAIEKLRPFLPQEFWDNRDFFFYEGMQLEIGPIQANYSPPDAYHAATAR